MRKGIFERAYLNWHYRKDILMKDISERAFPKGHFDEGHFEGRAFPKGERAKGMKGIVHKLEFSLFLNITHSTNMRTYLDVEVEDEIASQVGHKEEAKDHLLLRLFGD